MSDYTEQTAQSSEFFRFCEPLKGYDVFFGEKLIYKWELFSMSQNREMRLSISRRENKRFTYRQRPGWHEGVLNMSELQREEKKSGMI